MKTKEDYKKFLEAFGWRLAPHVLELLWKIKQAPVGTTIGVSGPRQIFKTETGAIWLFEGALAGENGVYFSHSDSLRRDFMERISEVCQPLIKQGIVKRINENSGVKEIHFANGATIYFRVRSSLNTITGLAGISRIVYDEAQLLDSKFYGKAKATQTFGESKKSLLLGTPPTDEDMRLVPENQFAQMRSEGGKNWIEYTASKKPYSPNLKITLPLRKKANPAWTFIDDFGKDTAAVLKEIGHEMFCLEYLGIWKAHQSYRSITPEFSASQISKTLTVKGSSAERYYCCIGITAQSQMAYICMSDGEMLEVALKAEFDVSDGNLDQVVDWVRTRSSQIRMVHIPGNRRGKALEALFHERRYLKTKILTMPDTSNRVSRLVRGVKEQTVRIYETPLVKLAMATFWVGYDLNSGGVIVRAANPEQEALMLSLALGMAEKPKTDLPTKTEADIDRRAPVKEQEELRMVF